MKKILKSDGVCNECEVNYGNVLNTFIRIIGYLNLILQFDTYKEDYKEYSKILDVIKNWAVQYEKNRNLDFVNNDVLVDIYEKSDELQTKYICNDNIGSESEYSDYIVNLLWDLRIIYKKHKIGSNENVE